MIIKKNILIVDDHEDDRELLKQLLESQDYQVLLAENGEHAQEILVTQSVDLTLSDMLMPVIDGIQLCKFIKTSDNLKHIPVILYSSIYSNEEDVGQALLAGAEHYIVKPIDAKKLFKLLSEVTKSTFNNRSNEDRTSSAITQNKEQQLKLYSTQLVKRLEQEVHNLQQEITKRKALETELVNAKQFAEITLNSIGDAVITTDQNGLVTSMNPVAEKLTCWSLQNALGQPVKTIFPIVDATTRQPIENPIEKIIAIGETVHLSNHTTLIAKDGTEYQIADSAAPIRDHDENILGMVLVFRDVTEQYHLREQTKLAQKSLQDKEKEQREILNYMVNAVISIDETGSVLSFNKAAENLFGYNFEEIKGQNVKRLMPAPYDTEHDAYLQRYLLKHSSQAEVSQIIGAGRNVKGLRKNGSVFPMRLLIAELPQDINDKRRFIGTCFDQTQIQQQEEQLRRTQKMNALGKLTGGIAHDFNNMLGVIVGYSDILKSKLADQPKLINYANNILHAGQRGAKLTNKLLSFSRIQSPEATKINLDSLLLGQRDLLQKTLTVRIKLLIKLADNLWSIWLDSSDLEDAILNMCINAMHAMGNDELDAQLTISTRNQILDEVDAQMLGVKAGDYVQLSIIDNGVGMDDATREKIFDPFFSTKGKGGTGLGLSQVFGFVKRSGGTIKVYSEVDCGSEFVIYFPRYHNDRVKNNVDTDDANIVERGNEYILIVDDEEALLELASEILSQQGYHIFCAGDGKQALQILENNHIDLVISDVVMPEMDGYQLVEIIKNKYPQVKIQLVSGFTDNSHLGNLDELLYQNLLPKPYTAQLLLKNVRALLDNK